MAVWIENSSISLSFLVEEEGTCVETFCMLIGPWWKDLTFAAFPSPEKKNVEGLFFQRNYVPKPVVIKRFFGNILRPEMALFRAVGGIGMLLLFSSELISAEDDNQIILGVARGGGGGGGEPKKSLTTGTRKKVRMISFSWTTTTFFQVTEKTIYPPLALPPRTWEPENGEGRGAKGQWLTNEAPKAGGTLKLLLVVWVTHCCYCIQESRLMSSWGLFRCKNCAFLPHFLQRKEVIFSPKCPLKKETPSSSIWGKECRPPFEKDPLLRI